MAHHHHTHHRTPTEGALNMTMNSSHTGGSSTPESILITEIVIFSTITFFTIVCNALILLSFAIQPRLRIYVNYFVMSLSFADFFVGLVNMTFYTYLAIKHHVWLYGFVWCHVLSFLTHFFLYGSVFTILVICLDRHKATYQPLVYFQQRSERWAMIKISLIWIGSFVVWFPFNFIWGMIDKGKSLQPKLCTAMYNTHHYSSIAAIVVGFWIPFPVIAVTSIRIWWMIKSLKLIRKDRLGVTHKKT